MIGIWAGNNHADNVAEDESWMAIWTDGCSSGVLNIHDVLTKCLDAYLILCFIFMFNSAFKIWLCFWNIMLLISLMYCIFPFCCVIMMRLLVGFLK
jgi:hypothetical protein